MISLNDIERQRQKDKATSPTSASYHAKRQASDTVSSTAALHVVSTSSTSGFNQWRSEFPNANNLNSSVDEFPVTTPFSESENNLDKLSLSMVGNNSSGAPEAKLALHNPSLEVPTPQSPASQIPSASNNASMGLSGVPETASSFEFATLRARNRASINSPFPSKPMRSRSMKIPTKVSPNEFVYGQRAQSTPNLDGVRLYNSGELTGELTGEITGEHTGELTGGAVFGVNSGEADTAVDSAAKIIAASKKRGYRRVSSGPLTTISPPSTASDDNADDGGLVSGYSVNTKKLTPSDSQRIQMEINKAFGIDKKTETVHTAQKVKSKETSHSNGADNSTEKSLEELEDSHSNYNMPFPKSGLNADIEKVPFFNETLTAGIKSVPLSRSRSSSVIFRPESGKSRYRCNFAVIFLFLFAVIFISTISVLIPWIVVLSQGTETTFFRYFNRQSVPEQTRLISTLQGPETRTILPVWNQSRIMSQAPITKVNTAAGLNAPYVDDQAFVSVMSNEKLQPLLYGIDYSPKNSVHPSCGANLRDIMLDLAALSQVTSRVRTYGLQCNQQGLIVEAIKTLGLNMTLSVGVWIGNDKTINEQQMTMLKTLMRKNDRSMFESVFVGNEVLFRQEKTVSELVSVIDEVKEFVHGDLGWQDLPVGTSELGSKINSEILDHCDVVGANIHPFFTGLPEEKATKVVLSTVADQIETLNMKTSSPAKIVISEVGWPYGGGSYQQSTAGQNQMQKFLKHWTCSVSKTNYPWYWFEAFDEPWKKIYNTGNRSWETQWGLFTSNRTLKQGISLLDVC